MVSFKDLDRYADEAEIIGISSHYVTIEGKVTKIANKYVELADPKGKHYASIYLIPSSENRRFIPIMRKKNPEILRVRGSLQVTYWGQIELRPDEDKEGRIAIEIKK
jgi:hypothetical protein